ncbi:MAG: hypothetical protein WBA75_11465 [Sphingopyxis granuli]
MNPQPVSLREPEIGALVAGTMTVLVRPIGRLAGMQPGDRLWVREPFHLPRAFAAEKPTRAAARGAVPIFVADHSAAWLASRVAGMGRRCYAREMPRLWHRQHLVVGSIERIRLHDVAESDLRGAGWKTRAAFRARWDHDARFGGALTDQTAWRANPLVLRIEFERIAAPLPTEVRQ